MNAVRRFSALAALFLLVVATPQIFAQNCSWPPTLTSIKCKHECVYSDPPDNVYSRCQYNEGLSQSNYCWQDNFACFDGSWDPCCDPASLF
jgi:hypothetical protein